MSSIVSLSKNEWSSSGAAEASARATAAMERGDVLFIRDLAFDIEPEERVVFSPSILSSSKNASYDPRTGKLGGTTVTGAEAEVLRRLMARFSEAAQVFVERVFPSYVASLERARASFRPAEIEGRQTSWRKDDTRLHVDAFPASPVQGRRILRVFTNVNPEGRPRVWRVGGEFEDVARRFDDVLRIPSKWSGAILQFVRVTKSRRTAYDALMLQLHDHMKEDADFQANSPQARFEFPAGTTWVTFTDQASHAAMSGQYQLEHTFYLPVSALADESRSPLRVLERLKGRSLA